MRGLWCMWALAACGRLGFDATADDYAGYERSLTIPAQPAPIDDFIASVQLTGFDPDHHARTDGADVHFVGNGKPLAFEIESWSAADSTLVAWVRIPQLIADKPTAIALRYGGDPIVHAPAATWTGVVVGAWHLGEATPPYRNSAGAMIDLTLEAPPAAPASAAGIAGRGLLFNGVDGAICTNDDDSSLDFGTGPFSYGIWIQINQPVPASFDIPFTNGGASITQTGYDIELGTPTTTDSISDGSQAINSYGAFGYTADLVGPWRNLTAVIDRSTNESLAYLDGALKTPGPLGTIGSLSSPASALCLSTLVYPFDGSADEARVYSRAMDPAWLALDFALTSRATQLAVGAERAP